MASTQLEGKPSQQVDPEQEPSVDWGWHGGFPRGRQIFGWIAAFAILMMLKGNHQGLFSGGGQIKDEDLWLIGTAAVLILALITDLRHRRRAFRRR